MPSTGTHQLVFLAGDVGDIHVVGGWAEFFKLLAGEDIDGLEIFDDLMIFDDFKFKKKKSLKSVFFF